MLGVVDEKEALEHRFSLYFFFNGGDVERNMMGVELMDSDKPEREKRGGGWEKRNSIVLEGYGRTGGGSAWLGQGNRVYSYVCPIWWLGINWREKRTLGLP